VRARSLHGTPTHVSSITNTLRKDMSSYTHRTLELAAVPPPAARRRTSGKGRCALAVLGMVVAACQDAPTRPSVIRPPDAPSFHATTTTDGRTKITFVSPADFQLLGDATPVVTPFGEAIRLTRAGAFLRGAAWLRTKQFLAGGFQAEFHFRISPDGCFPADGMAFVLHNDSRGRDVIGDAGHNIGYAGISRGLAVEFDTWDNNEFPDPNANHVAVMSNGAGALSANHATALGLANLPASQTLSNGTRYRVVVDYRPGILDVFFAAGATPLIRSVTTLTSVRGANLLDANGMAWVGFTAATGGACEAHYVELLPNAAPVANAGGPYTADEGSPVTLSAAQSEDADGDPLTFAWDIDGDGEFDDGTTEAVEATFGDNGTYTPRLRVIDHHGAASFAQAEVTINNVVPTLFALNGPADPHAVGSSISVSATYSDAGLLDTHGTSVDWGDGSTGAGAAADGVALASHVYTGPGVYTVRMTVTDDDGGVSSQRVFQYVVVYDPNGGFVTGGGWIWSPAGAYAADPTLTGKASFGFVAKYLPGANKPGGNTEFQFKAGSLNFRSTSYDWLVVAGTQAKYKGEGTINGGGAYGFTLTAVDGALPGGGGTDAFRIKIWDLATGAVVYDNKMSEGEDSDAATALGGGSIVIHK
jgi:PKD repeat protein